MEHVNIRLSQVCYFTESQKSHKADQADSHYPYIRKRCLFTSKSIDQLLQDMRCDRLFLADPVCQYPLCTRSDLLYKSALSGILHASQLMGPWQRINGLPTGALVDDFWIRKARYSATCKGLAGKICIPTCLALAHFFQRRKAPLYFLTVEGALPLNTTTGRNSARALSSGLSTAVRSCQIGSLDK